MCVLVWLLGLRFACEVTFSFEFSQLFFLALGLGEVGLSAFYIIIYLRMSLQRLTDLSHHISLLPVFVVGTKLE